MKEDKIYELLSGLVDNELPPQKKITAMGQLKNDKQWQEEYDHLCQVKDILSSHSPQLETSPGFEAALRSQIYEEQSQQSWFERLLESGSFGKLSYGLVAASVMFIGFLGYKIYVQDNVSNGTTLALVAANQQSEVVSPSSHGIAPRQITTSPHPSSQPVVSTHNQLADTAIIGSNGDLTIYKGYDSIRINLHTGKPFNKTDESRLSQFQDILSKLTYFQGLYFRDIGDLEKSQYFFQEFIKANPDSQLADQIKAKGLVQKTK